MNTSTVLKTGFAIAVAYFGSTACVARECTSEEQQEVGATGAEECKTYTPPEQHIGDKTVETLDYTAGTGLSINGDFRNLEIEAFDGGGTGEVEVSWTPVVDLAQGRSKDEVENTLEQLDVSIGESGGNITVNAKRLGSSNVAAILNVRIPNDFSGDIKIEQGGDANDAGDVDLLFLANAKHLNMDLNSSANKTTVKGGDLETAEIHVNGFCDIETDTFASPSFGGASITAENGDIRTSFSSVPAGAAVKVISEDGDVSVALPGEGDYTMQATSSDFEFGAAIPSSCSEATNAGGGSLTCGAGSEDKRLDFDLEATDGALEIRGFLALTE